MYKLRKSVDALLALYYRSMLRKDQWKDPPQLKEIQFKKLKATLKDAYNHVPYYHRLFSAARVRPGNIKNCEDMRKIPLTPKQDVKRDFPDMVARGVDASRLDFGVTAGSTGITVDEIPMERTGKRRVLISKVINKTSIEG